MKRQFGTLSSIGVMMLILTALTIPVFAQTAAAPVRGGVCCLVSTAPATAAEIKWLVLMREEEKLAHDVYTQLYAKWKLRLFDNISRSESRHFETIGALLVRYGVTDPAGNTVANVYTDPTLTSLYYTLMEKGMTSVKDALEVGKLIEQQDIADLQKALVDTTKTDIKTVYTNLLSGSLSHLDSFEQVLEIYSGS
jgi:hypothetical protein